MEQNYGLDRHLKVKTGAWYKYSECSVLEYLEMVHKWIKALRAMRIKQTPYWPKTPKVLRSYCLAGFLAGAQRFTTHSLSLSKRHPENFDCAQEQTLYFGGGLSKAANSFTVLAPCGYCLLGDLLENAAMPGMREGPAQENH